MTSLRNHIAVVTGASGGIGASLVEKLAVAGASVHAVARDAARLKALSARTGCVVRAADVTDDAAMTALFSEIEADILVCNAGMNFAGSLAGAEADAVRSVMDVNIGAVLNMVRLALPGMMQRDRGHIVFTGSIAGHHAMTGGNAVYHASKAAIHALSDQLRVDLIGRRIRVTEVAPGRTRTDIFAKVVGDADVARQRFLDGYEPLEPGDVADAIMFAVSAPAHVNISHIEMTPTLQVVGGLTTLRTSETIHQKS